MSARVLAAIFALPLCDTNVLVRLIVADDAGQGKRAAELFARTAQVFIAKTVVLETA